MLRHTGTNQMPSGAVPIEPPAAGLSSAPEPIEGELTLEVRRDLNWSQDDVAALDALIETRPHVGVFLTTAWLSGFFAEPPPGFEPSVLMMRARGVLQGIVPLATRQTSTHVRVTLLGGGLGSDRIDLLTARGYETTCSDRFLAWLNEWFGRRGFVLELRDVPADSALWGAIGRACTERTVPLVVQPIEMNTLPYLDLAAPHAGSAAGSPNPGSGSLDKHRRWLERRGRVRIETIHDPAEAVAAFEVLGQFLQARWQGTGVRSALDHPRTIRFHRHVLPLLIGQARLRMFRLMLDMRPVAVFYGLSSTPGGGWWGYYLAGYDREWAGRIHLGRIAIASAVDLAFQGGASEFDFLKGVERVKYMWPVRERSTIDADVYSEGWGPQWTRATRATRETVAAFAKSARHLLSMRT